MGRRRPHARVAWLAGVGLAQFGEFGFVLLRVAQAHDVVDAREANVVMAAGILSMSVTPLLIATAPRVRAGARLLAPLARLVSPSGIEAQERLERELRDHAILVGHGVAGRIAAEALRSSGASFVALEVSADTLREARARGEPVYYGDATSAEALEHAAIERARVIAILVNDPSAVPRTLAAIRRCRTQARVIVRAHHLGERAELLALGAHEVVVDQVESAWRSSLARSARSGFRARWSSSTPPRRAR